MESNQENQNLNQSRVQKEKKSSNKLAILLLVIIGIVVFVWGIIYLGRMFAGGMENTKKDINKNIKGNIDSLNREMNKAIKDSMTIQRQAIDNKSSSWSRDLENYSNSNNNNYRSLERKVNCLIKTYSKKYDSLCKALDVKQIQEVVTDAGTSAADLMRLEQRGVTVRVLLDESEKSNNTNDYNQLVAAGIPTVPRHP